MAYGNKKSFSPPRGCPMKAACKRAGQCLGKKHSK
jgi:hypothetical protein